MKECLAVPWHHWPRSVRCDCRCWWVRASDDVALVCKYGSFIVPSNPPPDFVTWLRGAILAPFCSLRALLLSARVVSKFWNPEAPNLRSSQIKSLLADFSSGWMASLSSHCYYPTALTICATWWLATADIVLILRPWPRSLSLCSCWSTWAWSSVDCPLCSWTARVSPCWARLCWFRPRPSA